MFDRHRVILASLLFSMVWGGGQVVSAESGSMGDRFMSCERQLTFEGRRAGEGYFSADGKRMILQSERYPNNPFFQIYIMDMVTGDCDLVSPGVGRTTCSYFHPGGEDVMFASTHLDPNAVDVQRAEYAARNDPNAERKRWDYDPYFDIFSCSDRGRHLRRLTDAPGYDAEGAYSPDGKHIVFMSMRDAYPLDKLSDEDRMMWEKQPEYFAEIYIMNSDGSDQRRLTDWPGYDGGPFFTFDGERIIWRHFDESGLIADIYTMKLDGSDRRRLTDFGSMSWAPYMHPSGDYAIFSSNKLGFANFELFLVDALGEKEPVRVTYTDKFDGLPVFSPDGKTVSWTSSRGLDESYTAQIFMADWDHEAALAAIKAAPLRGDKEAEPTSQHCDTRCWPTYGLPEVVDELTPGISASELYKHVGYLASDELEGRMTGSEGVRKAGDYIAEQMRKSRLEPMGDNGTYFQAFPFPAGIELVAAKNALQVRQVFANSAAYDAILDSDFRPLSFSSNSRVVGEVVFAGYGLVVPGDGEKSAYNSYENLDVDGKIVLVLDDVPSDVTTEQRVNYGLYAAPRYKAKQAMQRGAKGFLLVIGPNSPAAGTLISLSRTDSDSGIVAACVTVETASKMLGIGMGLAEAQSALDKGEIPEDFKKIAETGSSVALTTHLERREGHCRNVIGLIPPMGRGSIADEYILVGAHYDHIGHGEGGGSRAHAGEEGKIHNGADDNASGTATVLELLAALADERRDASDDRPRRGIIVALWSGEEIGVIGSSYFAQHPPCPLGRIAAYVNFDMVGRLENGKLMLQGLGSSPDWRRLVEKVNVTTPLAVTLQDDPYLPTDTHAFYPAGIPIISFFTGVHEDYNRPTDDADTLNYRGMQRIAQWARTLVDTLAGQYEEMRYAEVKQARPRMGGGAGGRRVYTGMIPDFTAGDVEGMKVSGAQAGSPAEEAGILGGDVIIRFAGQDIKGLEDYAVVLRAVKPGDTAEIVVRRNGQEKTLSITPRVRD